MLFIQFDFKATLNEDGAPEIFLVGSYIGMGRSDGLGRGGALG